jgi:hypothetical protein
MFKQPGFISKKRVIKRRRLDRDLFTANEMNVDCRKFELIRSSLSITSITSGVYSLAQKAHLLLCIFFFTSLDIV